MGMGQNIERWRKRRALSQNDLGTAAGVSPNTIWRAENEGRELRPSTLRKIAAALSVPVEELTATDAGDGKASGGTA